MKILLSYETRLYSKFIMISNYTRPAMMLHFSSVLDISHNRSSSVLDISHNRSSSVLDISHNRSSSVLDISHNRSSSVLDISHNRSSSVLDISHDRSGLVRIGPDLISKLQPHHGGYSCMGAKDWCCPISETLVSAL